MRGTDEKSGSRFSDVDLEDRIPARPPLRGDYPGLDSREAALPGWVRIRLVGIFIVGVFYCFPLLFARPVSAAETGFPLPVTFVQISDYPKAQKNLIASEYFHRLVVDGSDSTVCRKQFPFISHQGEIEFFREGKPHILWYLLASLENTSSATHLDDFSRRVSYISGNKNNRTFSPFKTSAELTM